MTSCNKVIDSTGVVRRLEHSVAERLRSDLPLGCVAQCVEELVHNALNAGATCIAVRLQLPALSIQVADNGRGIPPQHMEQVGNRYYVSGGSGRGETLASLAEVSSHVLLESCSSSTTLCKVLGRPPQPAPCPRPSQGTTVTVTDFLYNRPVRRQGSSALDAEETRRSLIGLALAHPSVSLSLHNGPEALLRFCSCTSPRLAFAQLFGHQRAARLKQVQWAVGSYSLEGYMSTDAFPSKEHQFLFVNRRRVLKTRLNKAIHRLLKKHIGGNGSFVLDVSCPPDKCDRVTLDRSRTALQFAEWDAVLELVEDATLHFLRREKLLHESPPDPTTAAVEKEAMNLGVVNFKLGLFSHKVKRPNDSKNESPVCDNSKGLDCPSNPKICLKEPCNNGNLGKLGKTKKPSKEETNSQQNLGLDIPCRSVFPRQSPLMLKAPVQSSMSLLKLRSKIFEPSECKKKTDDSVNDCEITSKYIFRKESPLKRFCREKKRPTGFTSLASTTKEKTFPQPEIQDSDRKTKSIEQFNKLKSLISERNSPSSPETKRNENFFSHMELDIMKPFSAKCNEENNIERALNEDCSKPPINTEPFCFKPPVSCSTTRALLPSSLFVLSKTEDSICPETNSNVSIDNATSGELTEGIFCSNDAEANCPDCNETDVSPSEDRPNGSNRVLPSTNALLGAQVEKSSTFNDLPSMPDESRWVRAETKTTLYIDSITGNSTYDDPPALKNAPPTQDPRKAHFFLSHDFSPFVTAAAADVTGADVTDLKFDLDQHIESREKEDWHRKWRNPFEERDDVQKMFHEWENPMFDVISEEPLRPICLLNTCRFTKQSLESLQVIGQVDCKFIACVVQDLSEDSPRSSRLLVLFDQHAVHERIRLEEITQGLYETLSCGKRVVRSVKLPHGGATALEPGLNVPLVRAFCPKLRDLGIHLSIEGDATVRVDSIPSCFFDAKGELRKSEQDTLSIIQSIVSEWLERVAESRGASSSSVLPQALAAVLNSQACRGAVKFGDRLSVVQCSELLSSLAGCQLPFQCAHGRPSIAPLLPLQPLLTPHKREKPGLGNLSRASFMEFKKEFPPIQSDL